MNQSTRASRSLALPRGRVLGLTGFPKLIGILNVTPDSFSDGGVYFSADSAVERARQMEAQGAAVIDVGGESSRPPLYSLAERVGVEEEIERTAPVIARIRSASDIPISIDTTKAAVAEAAIAAGADIVNDVSGLSEDARMAGVVAHHGVPVILMHRRGTTATMSTFAVYEDVTAEVCAELGQRTAAALAAGVRREQIVVDPGIGFAKSSLHNLEILAHLESFVALGFPLALGASRKNFLGELAGGAQPDSRLEGSLAVAAVAAFAHVDLLRVHDVGETAILLRTLAAILELR